MTHIKISRQGPSYYIATGFIGNALVQYSLMKTLSGLWILGKTYGDGPEFFVPFNTKRSALAALEDYR